MNFAPLLQAPLAVQLHVATVVPAALLGAFILLRKKGTRRHKYLGRIWMVLMVVTAMTSFFIHQINLLWGFSPIHILSVLVIAGCIRSVIAARQGDIVIHRRITRRVYFLGIIGAGLFAFMPGRIMNAVVFTDMSASSLAVGAATVVASALGCWLFRQKFKAAR
ncbi:DUF2306 domain-containing protein [Ochrobactrum soli]|uniref:DUF2306 domain-containing protein n=1 Tax=Ochrobactrum soli TaxID=2448455 RepID=A0A849KYY6_9HYPH|nr:MULTISPECIES: DUF2306 domain-containing protein [Brucella]NNU61842.1 DUF2306 domain-containing protein [[Ochrobactrum] soli]RLL75858.1 DUF2306 domain-containing protein [[Ochrobactrum] soli]WHS31393.1 DUF2306 domain-containing protein [Brucella sp. NM4]WHT42143.1 DUF2306 domain-containing protein [Ochrobactrum sp. SSR]